jgi:hypothetical protein
MEFSSLNSGDPDRALLRASLAEAIEALDAAGLLI